MSVSLFVSIQEAGCSLGDYLWEWSVALYFVPGVHVCRVVHQPRVAFEHPDVLCYVKE